MNKTTKFIAGLVAFVAFILYLPAALFALAIWPFLVAYIVTVIVVIIVGRSICVWFGWEPREWIIWVGVLAGWLVLIYGPPFVLSYLH